MGIVRIDHEGHVEVIDPGTPEEEERAREGLMRIVRALARVAAARDFNEELERRRAEMAEATFADTLPPEQDCPAPLDR